MKTLIIYSSKYGCTKKCAELLDMGKIGKDITRFYRKIMHSLLQIKVILFASHYPPKDTKGFFTTIFDYKLLNHVLYVTTVGREMDYSKMNYLYLKMFELLNKINDLKKGFIEPTIDIEEIKNTAKLVKQKITK